VAKLRSEIELTCPCCGASLVVDKNLDRIVSHQEPVREDWPDLDHAAIVDQERQRPGPSTIRRVGEVARRCAVLSSRKRPPGSPGADHQPTRDFDSTDAASHSAR
jgi:hypothetical protein